MFSGHFWAAFETTCFRANGALPKTDAVDISDHVMEHCSPNVFCSICLVLNWGWFDVEYVDVDCWLRSISGEKPRKSGPSATSKAEWRWMLGVIFELQLAKLPLANDSTLLKTKNYIWTNQWENSEKTTSVEYGNHARFSMPSIISRWTFHYSIVSGDGPHATNKQRILWDPRSPGDIRALLMTSALPLGALTKQSTSVHSWNWDDIRMTWLFNQCRMFCTVESPRCQLVYTVFFCIL